MLLLISLYYDGYFLCFQVRNIISSRGKKHPLVIPVVTLKHVTAALTTNAAGDYLPPYIIFQGGYPRDGFYDGVPDNWVYNYSESGHMSADLMLQYLKYCFEPNCGKDRPVVLIVDNHSSHLTKEVIDFCLEKKVFISQYVHLFINPEELFVSPLIICCSHSFPVIYLVGHYLINMVCYTYKQHTGHTGPVIIVRFL